MAELGATLGGRYRLDQVLGQGGMATIFRATDSKLGREVAVKVLRPAYGTDRQFVERFEREAQSAASLSHPNIVAVYDFGNDPAGPYIVMEQVAGGDLSVVLNERGALPPTAVARTGQQVADALAAAHARRLVHRDIKPSNILLSPDGRVQVADFGIAQAAAGSPITATGITLGSVLYFSPEQARGETATAASDIYSLGLVMYEMLTGKRAFSGDSPAAVAVARLSGGVPSPMAARPEVPPSLDAIVRWCLAVDPAARPTASQLSAALARFISDPAGAVAVPAGVISTAGMTAAWAGVPGVPPPPTQTVLRGTSQPAAGEPERSTSGPWAWVAAGLGLLVIVASGILLFLLFSGIGEGAVMPSPTPTASVPIVGTPDFISRREPEALRLAERRGLTLEVAYVEDDERAGRVIDQLPQPGVEIPQGTSVQVTVATHVETIVVPDVHGINEPKGLEQLQASGLRIGERFVAEDLLPAGYLVVTDPRAGVSVTRGSVVDYVVSLGPPVRGTPAPERTPWPAPTDAPVTAAPAMSLDPAPSPRTLVPASTLAPIVVSSPEATVTAEPRTPRPTRSPAASLGTTVSPAPVSSPTRAPSMSPTLLPTPPSSPRELPTLPPMATLDPLPSVSPGASGSPLPSPSPSPFPTDEMTLVGDFLCLDLATARSHLEKAGLLVGVLIPNDPPPDDSWLVHEQLPKPGESAPVGSAVNLRLMDPLQPCP